MIKSFGIPSSVSLREPPSPRGEGICNPYLLSTEINRFNVFNDLLMKVWCSVRLLLGGKLAAELTDEGKLCAFYKILELTTYYRKFKISIEKQYDLFILL